MALTREIEQFSLFHAASELFRLADPYRSASASIQGILREPSGFSGSFPWSERHLQCFWADHRLRPDTLQARNGKTYRIVDPGSWNHEAGPDFLGGILAETESGEMIRGDIEIHIRPGGWKAHGHHTDTAFRGVIAHVCWFPGGTAPGLLPKNCITISLKEQLERDPSFSLEAIDITAYPYAVPAGNRIAAVLSEWSYEEKLALLEAAGAERLLRKKERIQYAMETRSRQQVFYEEIMAGLGYRKNTGSFRDLARRLPLEWLRSRCRGDVTSATALLLGTAGLLPFNAPSSADDATKTYLRALWDQWWRHAADLAPRCMPSGQWTLTGLRPANRPERRLAAAACFFGTAHGTMEPESLKCFQQALSGSPELYFASRYTFGGKPLARPQALVGQGRSRSIAINSVLPWLEACGKTRQAARFNVTEIPAGEENHLTREASHYLFGPDAPSSLVRTELRRQGLLQIFFDFLAARRPEHQARLLALLNAFRQRNPVSG